MVQTDNETMTGFMEKIANAAGFGDHTLVDSRSAAEVGHHVLPAHGTTESLEPFKPRQDLSHHSAPVGAYSEVSKPMIGVDPLGLQAPAPTAYATAGFGQDATATHAATGPPVTVAAMPAMPSAGRYETTSQWAAHSTPAFVTAGVQEVHATSLPVAHHATPGTHAEHDEHKKSIIEKVKNAVHM